MAVMRALTASPGVATPSAIAKTPLSTYRSRCALATPPRAAASPTASGDFDAASPAAAPPSTKYLRILRFVDEHSTPQMMAGAAAAAPIAAAVKPLACAAAAAPATAWHASYDEEAEEGGELSEPGLLCGTSFAAATAAAAHSVQLPAGHSTVYSTPYWHRRLGDAPAASSPRSPRSSTSERCSSQQQRRAAFGDLECMAPWVDPTILAAAAEAQAAVAATGSLSARRRYAALMAFVESSAVAPLAETLDALARFREADRQLPYRPPQSWQFTFDEDVHADGVLGSC